MNPHREVGIALGASGLPGIQVVPAGLGDETLSAPTRVNRIKT
jgi:hypothetical protein